MIIIAKAILLLFLLLISFAILASKNFVHEVIYLGVFSLVMALLYVVMKAPDVAITEASVGACISTLLLLWAIKNVNEKEQLDSVKSKTKSISAFVIVCVTGVTLFYALQELPIFGSENSPINNDVYHFYIEKTKTDFGFPNIVTAILAGFRGYDTLGETVVIFTSAISVLLLLRVGEND